MKFVILFVVVATLSAGTLIMRSQVVEKSSGKRMTPQRRLALERRESRARDAVRAIKYGNGADLIAARHLAMGLYKGDAHVPEFAAAFAERGDLQTAYTLLKKYAPLAASGQDDATLQLYSRIADETGHHSDAEWARKQIGPEGHFRSWVETQRRAFEASAWPLGRAEFERVVRKHMKSGVQLYPEKADEISHLEAELLAQGPHI